MAKASRSLSKPVLPPPPPKKANPVKKRIPAQNRNNGTAMNRLPENISEYIKANENHIESIEKRLSDFIKTEDVKEMGELKEHTRELLKRIERLEDRPMVPPMSVASKHAMSGLAKKIERLEDSVNSLMKTLDRESEDRDAMKTHTAKSISRLSKHIERLKESVNQNASMNKEQEERLETEFNALRREAEESRALREKVENINLDGLGREIESLKQKSKWIQDNIEKIDIGPLCNRIEEMEHRLKLMAASSPHVIE